MMSQSDHLAAGNACVAVLKGRLADGIWMMGDGAALAGIFMLGWVQYLVRFHRPRATSSASTS